jgi:hypothetical protein
MVKCHKISIVVFFINLSLYRQYRLHPYGPCGLGDKINTADTFSAVWHQSDSKHSPDVRFLPNISAKSKPYCKAVLELNHFDKKLEDRKSCDTRASNVWTILTQQNTELSRHTVHIEFETVYSTNKILNSVEMP